MVYTRKDSQVSVGADSRGSIPLGFGGFVKLDVEDSNFGTVD